MNSTDSATATATDDDLYTITTPSNLPTVAIDSLPCSLRHLSASCALDEARDLVQFLDEATFFQGQADDRELSQRGCLGMQLVIGLIKDKLDIARGAYRFPIGSHRSDTELAQRVG